MNILGEMAIIKGNAIAKIMLAVVKSGFIKYIAMYRDIIMPEANSLLAKGHTHFVLPASNTNIAPIMIIEHDSTKFESFP